MGSNAQILLNILLAIIAGAISGTGLWAFLDWVQQFVKLTARQQANAAILLALVLPPAAYGLVVLLSFQQFDISTMILSIFAGYAASQRIHTEAQQRAAEAAQAAIAAQ